VCLTHAKQAQPALYNGHEIIKDNHARAKVHNTEDTLEIAEITRMKMNAKMTDPECVTHKGIQKALTKEVKQMKDVFEELEAKVAQCAVDRKHDAIELKNLLIANDNLIAKCLSQEVFCVATNTELNVARFTDMHVANTTAETRVDCCPIASRSQPMSHVKPNRISPAKGDNKLPVDDQPRKIKVNLRTSNHIDSSSHLKRT
nr:hypothetical protein [Tanacetum cinerariifolium]